MCPACSLEDYSIWTCPTSSTLMQVVWLNCFSSLFCDIEYVICKLTWSNMMIWQKWMQFDDKSTQHILNLLLVSSNGLSHCVQNLKTI